MIDVDKLKKWAGEIHANAAEIAHTKPVLSMQDLGLCIRVRHGAFWGNTGMKDKNGVKIFED